MVCTAEILPPTHDAHTKHSLSSSSKQQPSPGFELCAGGFECAPGEVHPWHKPAMPSHEKILKSSTYPVIVSANPMVEAQVSCSKLMMAQPSQQQCCAACFGSCLLPAVILTSSTAALLRYCRLIISCCSLTPCAPAPVIPDLSQNPPNRRPSTTAKTLSTRSPSTRAP